VAPLAKELESKLSGTANQAENLNTCSIC